jgi:hypothetical protein
MIITDKRRWQEFEAIFIIDSEHDDYDKAKLENNVEKMWFCEVDLNTVCSFSMVLDDNGEPYVDRCSILLDNGVEFVVHIGYEDFKRLLK